MEEHFQLSDSVFKVKFERGTLDPATFTHEAHLRLAWIHLQEDGLEQAILNITSQLQRFVAQLGAADKYNHTLTVAAIKAVDHFKKRSKQKDFQNFIIEHPRLKYSFKELLAAHYSFNIFHMDQAKSSYLEPDLLPFD